MTDKMAAELTAFIQSYNNNVRYISGIEALSIMRKYVDHHDEELLEREYGGNVTSVIDAWLVWKDAVNYTKGGQS